MKLYFTALFHLTLPLMNLSNFGYFQGAIQRGSFVLMGMVTVSQPTVGNGFVAVFFDQTSSKATNEQCFRIQQQ